MSSTRTSRIRLAGAAAATVLAALSLSACGDGAGVKDEGASTDASASVSASADTPASTAGGTGTSPSPSAPSTAQPEASAGSKGGVQTPRTKPAASSGKAKTCEGGNTRTVAAPLTRPVNHMLLTVTNTGSVPCHLYACPAVRFGEAQAVPPVIAASRPQAVVTLGPGESGYASVNLSAADGSGANGHTVKTLTVYFHGPSGNESVGAGAHPPLPAKGVYVDDSLKVTYWQQSLDDAVIW